MITKTYYCAKEKKTQAFFLFAGAGPLGSEIWSCGGCGFEMLISDQHFVKAEYKKPVSFLKSLLNKIPWITLK